MYSACAWGRSYETVALPSPDGRLCNSFIPFRFDSDGRVVRSRAHVDGHDLIMNIVVILIWIYEPLGVCLDSYVALSGPLSHGVH